MCSGFFGLNIPQNFSSSKYTQLSAITIFTQLFLQKRSKTVRVSAYRRPPRASPTGQSRKAHIGIKRLPAEYVMEGQLLVKQRIPITMNPNSKRNRHFKLYPGENVGVTKTSSLVALGNGRVKINHDVERDVKIVNVLLEEQEELLESDLWRYRMEHVRGIEENRSICYLRSKCASYLDYKLTNPPTKPPPRPQFLSKFDKWENLSMPDVKRFTNKLY
ncbi:hypothetical protein BMR1_03g00505 [Babesia microti strain RI]|uniref:Uncharacterized protein n=1 Tax=Babesia microti (strain RI) TaxID=1133968 RepID=A0A0K3AT18_BABMR|nr:hypothetical protein BMR1_03g00505 [Babesia microti strain RI]CTQ40701.1 hypothetical protein BMR1_03g00505 [Babesia microti strain RI]|eukprot:XP_012648712.1 hypothetical protein BMR1_03g00505 [Babesia microti strain RI]